jgi:hypothetical protein
MKKTTAEPGHCPEFGLSRLNQNLEPEIDPVSARLCCR